MFDSRQHVVHSLGDGRALARLPRRYQPLHSEPRPCTQDKAREVAVS